MVAPDRGADVRDVLNPVRGGRRRRPDHLGGHPERHRGLALQDTVEHPEQAEADAQETPAARLGICPGLLPGHELRAKRQPRRPRRDAGQSRKPSRGGPCRRHRSGSHCVTELHRTEHAPGDRQQDEDDDDHERLSQQGGLERGHDGGTARCHPAAHPRQAESTPPLPIHTVSELSRKNGGIQARHPVARTGSSVGCSQRPAKWARLWP